MPRDPARLVRLLVTGRPARIRSPTAAPLAVRRRPPLRVVQRHVDATGTVAIALITSTSPPMVRRGAGLLSSPHRRPAARLREKALRTEPAHVCGRRRSQGQVNEPVGVRTIIIIPAPPTRPTRIRRQTTEFGQAPLARDVELLPNLVGTLHHDLGDGLAGRLLGVAVRLSMLERTVHAANREEAEQRLLDFRRELRDEGVPSKDPTVAEFAEEWGRVMQGRVKARTWSGYEGKLRLWVMPTIGGMKMRKVASGDVQRAIDRVAGERTARTAHHTYRVVFEMSRDAERWDVVTKNVCTAVSPPRPSRPVLRIPTAEETRTIMKAVQGSIAEGPTILALGCGLRAGESVALRWRHVDLGEDARVRIVATMYRGKRDEPKRPRPRRSVRATLRRRVPPAPAGRADRALSTEVAWANGDYVFDRGGGLPRSVETVSRRFAELVEEVGLGDIRLHDCRHAFATRLLEAGVHPKVVSEALGHSSVAITLDTYSHVLPNMSGGGGPRDRQGVRRVVGPKLAPMTLRTGPYRSVME
jgi:integrase